MKSAATMESSSESPAAVEIAASYTTTAVTSSVPIKCRRRQSQKADAYCDRCHTEKFGCLFHGTLHSANTLDYS